jgi:hypothetical protein
MFLDDAKTTDDKNVRHTSDSHNEENDPWLWAHGKGGGYN